MAVSGTSAPLRARQITQVARFQKIARQINRQGRRAPGKRYAGSAMPIVMDEKFVAYSLGLNFKTFGAIWSETYNFTNDPIARDFNRCEVAIRI